MGLGTRVKEREEGEGEMGGEKRERKERTMEREREKKGGGVKKRHAKTFKATVPHINCHGTVLSACTRLNPNRGAQLQLEAMVTAVTEVRVMSLLSSARVADHPPELCPSQSSCRNRKRSQVNSSSCSTFSPVGRAEDERDHAQVPSLLPPPPTLAYPASSFLHPEQNRVPDITLLSEAPRIMRFADVLFLYQKRTGQS